MEKILNYFLGGGICPYQLSFILESPFRGFILYPAKLANRLHLKKNLKVLEISPGSGYFSIEVTRYIPCGYLELLDIQQGMLLIFLIVRMNLMLSFLL